MAEKIVALCSGGFDSIVMLNDLARNPSYDVHALFFDYGQKNVKQEMKWFHYWVHTLCIPPCNTLNLILPKFSYANTSMTGNSEVEDYEDLKAQYVPMRNMIFASYALSYAQSVGATKVFMAILGGGTYPDTTPDFIFSLNEIAGDVGIEFVTPFINHDKMYLYSRAIEYGMIEQGGKANFFSCNTPINGEPCGMCPDCEAVNEMISLYPPSYFNQTP